MKSMHNRILRLSICALFAALSIVFGKYLSISTDLFRISFENLTVIMAGIFFGPIAGALTGACADLLGCVLVGYSINPLITVGAASVGFLAGGSFRVLRRLELPALRLYLSVMIGHTVGSMVIKTFGLWLYFGQPIEILIWRVPLYTVLGALEFYLIYMLMRSKAVLGALPISSRELFKGFGGKGDVVPKPPHESQDFSLNEDINITDETEQEEK